MCQNFSMEVLLLGPNFNQKPLWSFPSKDEGLREFGHNMSLALDKEIYFKESTLVTVSYWVHYDTLYKMRQPFYYKIRQKFIAKFVMFFITINATVLLQNVTVITRCVSIITKCDIYYEMRCLLQGVSVQAFILCWSKYTKLRLFALS